MTIDRGQRAGTKVIAAPVGGLNTRDALAAMPETDASVMTNLFPYADRVETRAGVTTDSTQATLGIANTYEGFRRLLRFTGAGVEALFGCFMYYETVGVARSRLKICSISGGVSTPVVDVVALGTTNSLEGLGESTLFTTAAGTTYLLLCATYVNAGRTIWTFVPQAYNGSAWSIPSITGLPNITLGVHSHRNRLWFYNTLNVGAPGKELSAWYLPTGSIAGAVTEFSLGPFASKGGRIVAMRTWTIDGGEGGSDDLAVFLTDEGQALIYQGTDPSSSSTWQQVGVFDVGKLASWLPSYTSVATDEPFCLITRDNFAMKYGRDILIATQNGITSMNRILRPSGEDGADFTISGKIRPSLTDAAAAWALVASSSLHCGWQMTYLPLQRQLIVSVPLQFVSNSATNPLTHEWLSIWYVMNTETGAWTTFTGSDSLNSCDSVVFNNKLYFIDGSKKVFYYDGVNGVMTSTTYECRQAYSYLDSPEQKLVTIAQPNMSVNGTGTVGVDVDADFNPSTTVSNTTSFAVIAATTIQPQFSTNKYGTMVAAHFSAHATTSIVVKWYSTKYLWSPGRLI